MVAVQRSQHCARKSWPAFIFSWLFRSYMHMCIVGARSHQGPPLLPRHINHIHLCDALPSIRLICSKISIFTSYTVEFRQITASMNYRFSSPQHLSSAISYFPAQLVPGCHPQHFHLIWSICGFTVMPIRWTTFCRNFLMDFPTCRNYRRS
jgi:hypothetical protein